MEFVAKCEPLGMTGEDMRAWFKEQGIAAFKGEILCGWLGQGVTDYSRMSNLSKKEREVLSEKLPIELPRVLTEQVSRDESCAKLLLDFGDDVQIELVIMNYDRSQTKSRHTLCISTQAGCAMNCAFCATGLGGLHRNLTAGEIVAQVQAGRIWLKQRGLGEVTNLVYMGMGEPFANYDEVMKSLKVLTQKGGINLGQRRITVSTCGLVPQIRRFAEEAGEINLAISLHTPNDELRCQLMPINRRYNLQELLAACDYYVEKTNRRISYEYALLSGVNDSAESARDLARLLRGKLAHINLIPVNFVEETGFYPSHDETINRFAMELQKCGIEVSVREKRGTDIDGACGQLRRKHNTY